MKRLAMKRIDLLFHSDPLSPMHDTQSCNAIFYFTVVVKVLCIVSIAMWMTDYHQTSQVKVVLWPQYMYKNIVFHIWM